MGHYIGFDMGGTKMISAVLDDELKILARERESTGAEEGSERVYKRVVKTVMASLESAGVGKPDAIGITVPGPLNRRKGLILETPNLGFRDFPLGPRLEKDFGVPVVLENDVSAGVYGEFCAGAAKGYRHVVGIFIGTGIGGGLVLDGRLYGGATGNAGEIGHMILQIGGPLCGCGQYGCVEALASRTSIAKDLAHLAGSGKAPSILKRAGTDIKGIKSGAIAKAIKAGEAEVARVVERAAIHVGICMANCVNVLSPEAIVLGGGLIEKLGETFLGPARQAMRDHAMNGLVRHVEVVAASLEDDAVPIGAAALARESRA
jgi:glucokinase